MAKADRALPYIGRASNAGDLDFSAKDIGTPARGEGDQELIEQSPEIAPPKVDVRQQLAGDRTLLAWLRTSVTLAGLGFVVARFHLLVQTTVPENGWHEARILGVALVAVALLVIVLGLWQHRQVRQLLAAHGDDLRVSQRPAVIAASVFLIVLVALCVYLAASVH